MKVTLPMRPPSMLNGSEIFYQIVNNLVGIHQNLDHAVRN